MRERRTSIFSLTAAVSWRLIQKKLYERGLRTNLVLGVDGGGGFERRFKGAKRFCDILGNFQSNHSNPDSPVFPVSSCDW